MRIAARTDANQAQLVDELRALPGVSVQHLHTAGKGCPDLLIGHCGRNWLLEIKNPSKPPSARLLSPAQCTWHINWTGQAAVVTTMDEIRQVLGL